MKVDLSEVQPSGVTNVETKVKVLSEMLQFDMVISIYRRHPRNLLNGTHKEFLVLVFQCGFRQPNRKLTQETPYGKSS